MEFEPSVASSVDSHRQVICQPQHFFVVSQALNAHNIEHLLQVEEAIKANLQHAKIVYQGETGLYHKSR